MNNIKLFYTALNAEGKNAKAGEIRADLESGGVKDQDIKNPVALTPGKVSLVTDDHDPVAYSYYVRTNDEKVPRILLARHYPKGTDPASPGEPTGRYVVYKPISETAGWTPANDDGQSGDYGYKWENVAHLRGVAQLNASYIFVLSLDSLKIYYFDTSSLDAGVANQGELLIDLEETFPKVPGYVPKGIKLVATEGNLYALHAMVKDPYDDKDPYAESKVTCIPINFADDGPPTAEAPEYLDVAKNASGLVATIDGKFVKLIIPSIGGPLTPGKTNGTESKIQVADFKKKAVTTAFGGLALDKGALLGRDTLRLNFQSIALNQSGSNFFVLTTALDAKGAGIYWRLYKTNVSTILGAADKTIDELIETAKLLDFTSDNPEKLGDPGFHWDVLYENTNQRLWFIRGSSIQVSEGPNYPGTPGENPSNGSGRRFLPGKALSGADLTDIHSADLVSETLYGSSRRQSQAPVILFGPGEGGHPVPLAAKAAELFANRAKG
jgi:hypothetical protein